MKSSNPVKSPSIRKTKCEPLLKDLFLKDKLFNVYAEELSDLLKLHRQLKVYLAKRKIFITDIQFCPYHPKGIIKLYRKKSGYRKPGNLMIKKILNKWNINLKKSFMLGDSKTDESAARKSNLYYEYVKNNFYSQVKKIEKKIANNC